jgi:acetyl-CoA carboxylase biotin carboxyl carrier protein
MTLEEIRELIQLVSETGVAELEVQRGENRVRIRPFGHDVQHPDSTFHVESHGRAHAPAALHTKTGAADLPPELDESLVLVKSPIVGTFYESSSPDSQPFVRVGERVAPGKVLCIIESMKLMNEIEAEVAGILESKLVPNGQPVEYGEALFAIRPI